MIAGDAVGGVRRWIRTAALRAVHLLLGGVLVLPYAALGWLFVAAVGHGDALSLGVLAVLALAAGVAVLFAPAVRPLEIVAARALLGVDLPDPSGPSDGDARRRGVAWFVLAAGAGAVATLAALVAVPTAVGLLLAPMTGVPLSFGSWTAAPPVAVLPVLGVAVAAVLGVLVVAGGAGLARVAPTLLGPTPSEELARARARAEVEARRARLSAELHDVVGHTLAAVTLQAAAARRVLDDDPDRAREALAAIEDRTRAAVADLDDLLGRLRDGDDPGEAGAVRDPDGRPGPGLEAVPDLCAGIRAGGTPVELVVTGDPALAAGRAGAVAHAVVRESLTNAVRHGAPGPVAVAVDVGPETLVVEVVNPVVPDRPAGRAVARAGGGRGLAGMRDRVAAVGGRLECGAEDDRWTVRAAIPRAGAVPS